MPEERNGFTGGVPNDVDPTDEVIVALYRLVAQARDESTSPLPRITAAINARTFLETLTRRLVIEAREGGAAWEEIGLLFGTSAANARARFGDYGKYDDD
jgi:hypothetical protein